MLTEVGLLRNAIERYPHKPSPVNTPSGCRFRTRCQFARERWDAEEPKLRSFGLGTWRPATSRCRAPTALTWIARRMTATGEVHP